MKLYLLSNFSFSHRCSSMTTCPVCFEDVESIEHMLFFCHWTKVFWFNGNHCLRFDIIRFTSFEASCCRWLLEFEGVDDFSKCLLLAMWWEVWKERCNVTF